MITLKIRKAQLQDSQDIHRIRSSKEVRERSHDSREFSFAEHDSWFKQTLTSTHRNLFVVTSNDEVAGVVRYDIAEGEKEATVSIFVAAKFWGQGVASFALVEGEKLLKVEHTRLANLRAEVLADNETSIKLFEKSGFTKNFVSFSKKIR